MIFIKKKVTLVIILIGLILLSLALWYKYEYSMDVALEYEINNPDYQKKLLIATQGSTFKDAITKNIVDYYKQDSIFIKIIDVSSLHIVKPENYNAIVLIHTWENWKPPSSIKLFIHNNKAYENKIITLTTSGKGTYKIKNIDAITGESELKKTDSYSTKIVERLKPLLKN